jgi:hypothetical protein
VRTSPRRFRTKYGLQTGQEWLRSRYLEERDKWLTPEKLHYIFKRIPYHDAYGREIVDYEFIYLLHDDPDAANRQLQKECNAFFADLKLRLARQEREKAEAKELIAQYVKSRRSRRQKKQSGQLSLPTHAPATPAHR